MQGGQAISVVIDVDGCRGVEAGRMAGQGAERFASRERGRGEHSSTRMAGRVERVGDARRQRQRRDDSCSTLACRTPAQSSRQGRQATIAGLRHVAQLPLAGSSALQALGAAVSNPGQQLQARAGGRCERMQQAGWRGQDLTSLTTARLSTPPSTNQQQHPCI